LYTHANLLCISMCTRVNHGSKTNHHELFFSCHEIVLNWEHFCRELYTLQNWNWVARNWIGIWKWVIAQELN